MARSRIRLTNLLFLSAVQFALCQCASYAQAAMPAASPASTPAPTPAAAKVSGATEMPHSEIIHRTLYSIYDRQGNHAQAALELDALIQQKPNDASFPFVYGQLLIKDGKWAEAQTRFEAAIKIDPTFSNAYCGLGDCRMKLKLYKEAVDAYQQASQNAKAGQDFSSKVAIAQQWQERKKQEDDFDAALKKQSGAHPIRKTVAKKK